LRAAAQEFGLPLLPPSKLNRSDLSHGANFAITGATALDTPYFEERGLGAVIWNSGALMTQIQWFRDLKPFFCNSTKGKMSKSHTPLQLACMYFDEEGDVPASASTDAHS
jgi:hypothetical protein